MSYPSIQAELDQRGLDPESASNHQLEEVYLAAFAADLPLGLAAVTRLVERFKSRSGSRAMLDLDPQSDTGQQYARLLAPDIPRRILEKHFGVAFGFYNCCRGVVAGSRDQLQLSLREQIEVQDPSFVDC